MDPQHQPYRDNGDKEPLYRRTSELAKLAPKVSKVGAYGALAFGAGGIACFYEGFWPAMWTCFALATLLPLGARAYSNHVYELIQADPSLSGSHYTLVADEQIERVSVFVGGLWRFSGGLVFVAIVGLMVWLGSK